MYAGRDSEIIRDSHVAGTAPGQKLYDALLEIIYPERLVRRQKDNRENKVDNPNNPNNPNNP